jgi:SAM-dependent methyltransferase
VELLLGCGNSRDKRLGTTATWDKLVTLDLDPDCGADIQHDLDVIPWPIEDNTFDEVHAYELLEHLGQQGDYRSFFLHFAEIYRVLKPGGVLFATTPKWDGVWAWSDPGHRRVISTATLVFLNQAEYAAQIGKTPMTDYRWLWKGDFVPVFASELGDSHAWALQAIKPSRLRAPEAR